MLPRSRQLEGPGRRVLVLTVLLLLLPPPLPLLLPPPPLHQQTEGLSFLFSIL
jgi:hypothetical protein